MTNHTARALVIEANGTIEVRTITTNLDSLKDILGGWLEGVSPGYGGTPGRP